MVFIVSRSDEELRKRHPVKLFETLKRKDTKKLEDLKHSRLSRSM